MLGQNGSVGEVTALGKEDSRSENRPITCECQRWIQRVDIRMGLISPQIIRRLSCIRYQYSALDELKHKLWTTFKQYIHPGTESWPNPKTVFGRDTRMAGTSRPGAAAGGD